MLNADALNQLKQLKQEIQATKQVFEGSVRGTPSRFGFVLLDDGREAFLTPDEMLKVFPGDRVRVELSQDDKGRDLAVIEKCLKSELKEFVGRYVEKGTAHFAEPDIQGLSRWLYIPPDQRKGAKAGDLIRCKVLQHPFRTGKPQVAVTLVLGTEQDIGIEGRYLVEKYNLGQQWPAAIEQEMAAISAETISKEAASRHDLRDWPFVTIDSETTQDMDDALCAEILEDGWRLHVAIADPASLIAPGSALDREAAKRASSFYLADRVVPMLPAQLANQLCSLMPGLERLALVCSMDIASDGSLRGYDISEAVIRSKAKLSYHEVAAFLADNSDARALRNAGDELHQLVDHLHAIQVALRQQRQAEALLTDDRPDYRLRLNAGLKIERIERSDTTPAHNLVEECMVAANRCAADHLAKHGGVGLFIVHPGFREDRLEQIQQLASEQLPDFDSSRLRDWQGFRDFMRLLEQHSGERPLKAVAVRQLTRSQVQASPAPHFGMGLPLYTTFTSPIRKYNDLLVHRAIKAVLHGQKAASVLQNNIQGKAIERLNETLRGGRQAAAEMEQWLKCQYAQQFKGQRCDGRIVHVNGAGLQVRLDENGLEGFVNLNERADKLTYDPVYLEHRNEQICFRLEQAVTVIVGEVDMKRRQVQLSLVDTGDAAAAVDAEETNA